jgi:hypothetical protein
MSNYIEKDHFKHYRDDNPFGSKCRLWDPDSKKWVDRLPSTKEIWQN